MSDGQPLVVPLHGMASVEGDKIIFTAHHVQASGGQFLDRDISVTCVYDLHAAGDHIVFRKHAVEQHCPDF